MTNVLRVAGAMLLLATSPVAAEIRGAETRAGETRAGETRAGETRAGETLPGPTFTRGINLNPWFTKPARRSDGGFADPPYAVDEAWFGELAQLRRAGFDFVRLPVRPDPLVDAPGRRRAGLAAVGRVAAAARGLGLGVVLDLHAVPGSGVTDRDLARDDGLFEAYAALVQDAARLARAVALEGASGDAPPGGVLLELMNEPGAACGDPAWPATQRHLADLAWAAVPTLDLVATGACLGGVDGLVALDPRDFAKPAQVWATFHYYTPFWFTHQGASWVGDPAVQLLTGLPWPAREGSPEASRAALRAAAPGNPAFAAHGAAALAAAEDLARRYHEWSPDARGIATDLARAAAWADGHGLPRARLILGEFGVLKVERRWRGAATDSAARWIAAVREEAERLGLPWAMWSYKEGMALAQTEEGTRYVPALVRALGLSGGPSGGPSGAGDAAGDAAAGGMVNEAVDKAPPGATRR